MFAVKREELIRSLNILSRNAPHTATGKRAKSITSRNSDLSSFLQEEMSLAEFPFGLGYSRWSAPTARSPPIDEAALGDYRSIA